jgi:hypothetical protein
MRRLHKNGRPTTTASIGIKDTLLKCYESGLSPYYAAQKTGHNLKTVYKYYNELSGEIEKSDIADFIERHKRDHIQTIISYDAQIDDAMKLLSNIDLGIESYTKEKKPIPKHLIGYRLDIMKFRSSLVEKKAAFAMQQPPDDALIEKVKSMKK